MVHHCLDYLRMVASHCQSSTARVSQRVAIEPLTSFVPFCQEVALFTASVLVWVVLGLLQQFALALAKSARNILAVRVSWEILKTGDSGTLLVTGIHNSAAKLGKMCCRASFRFFASAALQSTYGLSPSRKRVLRVRLRN